MDNKNWFTGSGETPVKAVYSPEDISGIDSTTEIGASGKYPFTRGYSEEGYRTRLWKMGAYSGFSSGEDANQRFKQLVERGAQRLLVALDLPTQIGYDPDSPVAAYEVGRVGVAINSLKDIEELFDGIPLENMMVGTTGNSISPIALAWFIALAQKRNCPLDKMACQIQNDILKEFIVRGTYIFPLEASLRVTTDVIEYCIKDMPSNWTPLIVCGTHMRSAGATPCQAAAFTLANAIAYFEMAKERNVSLEDFARRIEVHMVSGLDIFEEAATFRALRKIWARVMRDQFGLLSPQSQAMHMLSTVSPSDLLTAQQPLNNIARITLSLIAAVLGGTDQFSASAYDEALSIPTAEAVITSLRIQQIVAFESGLPSVTDPLGGSYYIEWLTHHAGERILSVVNEISEKGGALNAIKTGYYQKEMVKNAYEYQKQIETGERILVGVNEFRDTEDAPEPPIFRADPGCLERQLQKLSQLKSERNAELVGSSLQRVEEAAQNGHNLVPPVLEAVKAYATVGEICNVLRRVFGEYDAGLAHL